jgi:tetratricopeptide (TPR) repeat protein
MEILKLPIWLFACFLLISPFSSAQQQALVIRGFEESYALETLGQYKQAADRLQSIYQADSYEINLRLGWLYYLANMIDESIRFYNRAISLKPYAIEPRFGLVLPLSVQARWEEVLQQYQRILSIDPQNSIANYRAGLIFYNRSEYQKAEQHLEKVVNLYPFGYDGLILFAWTKLQLGKSREAQVLFNKVLMFSPSDDSAMEGLRQIK